MKFGSVIPRGYMVLAVVWLIVVMVPPTAIAFNATTLPFVRDYLNPNTGRFWTMDKKAGDQEDAKSLNRYSYGEGDPIDNVDPSGNAVWLVTRPLSIAGLNLLAPIAVHVFLAFDDNLTGTIGGGDPLPKWESEVQQDNQNVGTIMPAVLNKWNPYQSDPHLTTFSFHPYSVAAGNGEKNQGGVFGTSGSCVAYNAPEDHGAFYQAGGNAWGYKRYWITGDVNEQINIYKRAIESRDINNAGTPNEHPYSGFDYNCGSWTKFIVTRGGGTFPSYFINLGTGLGGPADYTGVPTLVTIGAQAWNPHYDFQTGGIDVFDESF
jgi:hypothetical protein